MVPRSGPAQTESMHVLDVQRAIDATLPQLRDRIPELDRAQQLPDDPVEAVRRSGLNRTTGRSGGCCYTWCSSGCSPRSRWASPAVRGPDGSAGRGRSQRPARQLADDPVGLGESARGVGRRSASMRSAASTARWASIGSDLRCGRRMDSHWVHGRAGYRCRHGYARCPPAIVSAAEECLRA
jgi:hypothetical protein